MTDQPGPQPSQVPSSRRRRVSAMIVLGAYLGFAVWAFAFAKSLTVIVAWFFPVSILIWLVLRALRPRLSGRQKN